MSSQTKCSWLANFMSEDNENLHQNQKVLRLQFTFAQDIVSIEEIRIPHAYMA